MPLKWMFVIFVLCRLTPFSRAASPANLITNPGFESDANGWNWITSAAASYSIDPAVHFDGAKSIRIGDGSKFQPDVYCCLRQTVSGLKENTAYRLGVWIKGKNVQHAWTGGGPGWSFHVPFPDGNFDWQHVEADYATHPGETSMEVIVIVEGPTESLWLDDFSLTEDAQRTQQMHAAAAKAAQEIQQKLARLPAAKQAEYQHLVRELASKPELSADPYIHLDMTVAKRFLDRIANDQKQPADWSVLQAEEVGEVLDRAEKLIQQTDAGQRAVVTDLPRPGPDRPELKDGAFWIKYHGQKRPFYFAGYGHFEGVIKDLPNFPALGASLIQDARFGPSSMNEDGSLNNDALGQIDNIQKAAQLGMRVDVLLSPHYFPKWAFDKAPDLPNGNPHWLNFQIDHPMARKVIGDYYALIADKLKDSPGLLSFCLSNEPAYEQAAREPYSRPMYEKFLADRYVTIDKLNEMYGTHYDSFAKVEVPGKTWPDGVGAQRAFYDWVTFDQEHWADFHKWMNDILKQHAPNVPTHAKMMVFYTMDRDRLRYGVDPELFCRATDLAGCDPHVFWTPDDEHWAYEWLDQEFWYDLMSSFRGQGIFNSENHIIPDGSGPSHIPSDHTYSVLWQGALHHQIATTIWVWDEPTMFPLSGSIYLRPANIAAAGRAMMDLSRFAPDVRAIESTPARFALLYSMPSAIWESPNYKAAIMSAYTALTLMGEPVTFISERQLAEAPVPPNIKCILIPQATHVKDATVTKLADYANAGGQIIRIGEGCLSMDEYHRPRDLPSALKQSDEIPWIDQDQAFAKILRAELDRDRYEFHDVLAAGSSQRAWGVEYRFIEQPHRLLVPIINMLPQDQTIELPGIKSQAVDLLTNQPVDPQHVSLPPMHPMLLAISD